MNAIDLLKNDHDYVDLLFGRIEDTPPSRHPAIFKQIKNELDTHAHIEEKIFYPAILKDGNKKLQDVTREGIQEHVQIKKFLGGVARTTSTDTREAKLKVLIEDTRHHVKEEENEMFPLVEDQFSSEQLDALGERMEAEKLKFQKAKRIPPRREEPKGALSKVVEKAMAVVSSVMGTSEEEEKRGTRSTGRAKAGSAKADSGPKRTSPTAARSGGRAKASSSSGSSSRSSSATKRGSASTGKTSSNGKSASNGRSKKSNGGSRARAGGSKSSSSSKSGSAKGRSSRASASR